MIVAKDDSKFLDRIDDVVRVRVGREMFCNYVPIKCFDQYMENINKFSGKQARVIEDGIKYQGVVNGKHTWEKNGKLFTVFDEIRLNYNLECHAFTSYLLDQFENQVTVQHKEMLNAVITNGWRKAKSTKNPHEYAVKKNWNGNAVGWADFLDYVNSHGVREKFWSRSYLVCNIGEYDYWCMGHPESMTVIMNRRKKGLTENELQRG